MIKREQMLAITELNLVGKVGQMIGSELADYVKLLNTFIEDFPDQEEKIKSLIEAKDYAGLAKPLTALCDALKGIYADGLADACSKQVSDLDNVKPEKLEAHMNYLLSRLSMLSIDIQMLYQQTDEPAAMSPDALEDADGYKKGKTILAVDDTAFFLTMLKTTLNGTEYKVTCVTSGRDGLKFLEKNQVDLFLLDIEMPGMNGYELAAKIRDYEIMKAHTLHTKERKAPIIFLTGNAKKDNVTKAMRAGGSDFIIKPINKELLIAKISKYI
jgi:CheY-like chemotaxis protein/HPt (histidine-containing phosphotransfer) domain-containing protein